MKSAPASTLALRCSRSSSYEVASGCPVGYPATPISKYSPCSDRMNFTKSTAWSKLEGLLSSCLSAKFKTNIESHVMYSGNWIRMPDNVDSFKEKNLSRAKCMILNPPLAYCYENVIERGKDNHSTHIGVVV